MARSSVHMFHIISENTSSETHQQTSRQQLLTTKSTNGQYPSYQKVIVRVAAGGGVRIRMTDPFP